MALQKLVTTQEAVSVQETTFSVDAVGRFACSTWDEATASGGRPFDAVVVGAGMYGAYCATRIFREHPHKRVLVLDAGRFLVGEHIQNLGRIGLDVADPIRPADDPLVARKLVWGLPWRGNVDFPGLAYCLGGKSLYWGGWCPRMTAADLQQWPSSTAQGLLDHYTHVEVETGVKPATDFISGPLFEVLFDAFATAAADGRPDVETALGTNGIEVAPLAVQGDSPVSGLFSFDKFSSLPMLIDAVREDVANSGLVDTKRRLFLVPLAHVAKLHTDGGVVRQVEVVVAGERRVLPISADCAVILASSAIESTRLALHSFPNPLMGRNLMAHVRSDFPVRIHRSALPDVPGIVETGALLVRGQSPTGRFHLQVTGSTSRGGSDDLLFRMIPDIEVLDRHLANRDPDWVMVTLRAIGEMHGDRSSGVPNPDGSWIDLSPFESDRAGPRAYVQLKLSSQDRQTWEAMDRAAVALVQAVAGDPSRIEYLYNGAFRSEPFPLQQPFPEWHRGLGSTYHESGTLWMGNDAASSVTNPLGRFHHVANAYVCDQSVFPTVGSVNPVLTGLTLARRLAAQLPT